MKKIPTLFERDQTGKITDQVNPNCQWVLDGEGVATRKFDGICCLYNEAKIWTRREVKPGKITPPYFQLFEVDNYTGKQFGWEPAEQSGFAKFIREAIPDIFLIPGTYELCGPKINGNPEKLESHKLIPHGKEGLEVLPGQDFDTLLSYLSGGLIEGIVWWHPDGRLCKIKAKDFGIRRI